MAYCVKCGVELAETEKKCPLCSTRIESIQKSTAPRRAYPPKREKIAGRSPGAAIVVLLFLLIPALICIINDFRADGVLGWSLHLLAAEACIYTYVIPPLYLKKQKALISLSMDVTVTGLALTLIGYLTHNTSWLLPLGIPLSLLAGLLIFGLIKISKTCLATLHKIAIGMAALGLVSAITEALSTEYLYRSLFLNWSLYVMAPLAVVAGILTYIEHDKAIKDKIARRIFI